MAYYKKIKGKDYDGNLLKIADAAVKGKGDGRISLKEAKRILATVKDSEEYTGVEKTTMSYIRDNYKFTEEANSWFRTEIRKWAAKKGKGSPARKTASPAKAAPAAKGRAERTPAPASRRETGMPLRETPLLPAPERKAPPPGEGDGIKRFFLAAVLVIAAVAAIFLIKPLKNLFFGPTPEIPRSGERSRVEEQKVPEIAKPAEMKQEVPAEKPAAPVEKPAAVEEKNIYVVKEKDTLIKISEEITGDYRNWEKIFDANRDTVQSPVLIFVGQRLRIPEGMTRNR
ncbi:MAG: LysM peptidoglycan-binding domain-containing protein [Spirochaetes bacterium]|nr:MAG: LysM peptidoglycan-binding domain-containing protein [Spirochaetota bacterium]